MPSGRLFTPKVKLAEPPVSDLTEAFDLTRVRCEFSGVAWINLEREWDEWTVILERVAHEHDVWLGVKCWYDAYGGLSAGLRELGHVDGEGKMICQLQVEDRGLPEPYRTAAHDGAGDWPQQAIWAALHGAGLVLERERPRRPVRDAPQA